jgi:hypothetical protein
MTNEISTEKSTLYRLEALRMQAQKEPLTWTPKKGEYLVGTFQRYGFENNRLSHIVIEDQKNIEHRICLKAGWDKQLNSAKPQEGDLISVQFIGKEKSFGYGGGNTDVFKLVIEKV